MKLFVGLGNPGSKYQNTKHNVGFIVLDELCQKSNFSSFKNSSKHNAKISKGSYKGVDVLAIKPQTYMNRSGVAVKSISNYYNIDVEDIIVFQDDLDLDFAKIKRKKGGSSGGHNGIKNITYKMGSGDFWRIKIGIGRPNNKHISISDYVLSRLSKDNMIDIKKSIVDIDDRLKQIL